MIPSLNRVRVALLLAMTTVTSAAPPRVRLECAGDRPAIQSLGWDTEGAGRQDRNLLRGDAVAAPRFLVDGTWRDGADLSSTRDANNGAVRFRVATGGPSVTMSVAGTSSGIEIALEQTDSTGLPTEFVFPFDPRVTPTTVIPAAWRPDGTFSLPAVVHAPDFGPMLLQVADDTTSTAPEQAGQVAGRIEGSRPGKLVNLALAFRLAARPVRITLSAVDVPPPAGLKDASMWKAVRRGWLNAVQPCSKWGDQNRGFSSPAGMLGNNVISDPASCSLWFYADQIFWVPQIAPGVSAGATLRRTIDWWLDARTRPDGEVVCYWDYGGFLDANAGPIIAAWDYVESCGDVAWLRERISRIEFIADFLARRDVDGDGLIEAAQSGNLGTLVQPNRSCAWWDALNCGHKDGYTNAVIYRAFRCLADLERKLQRSGPAQRYGELGDRLKASYARTLLSPRTGWLGWWRSLDGELHDYASPTLNGIAIEYGLVGPAEGRAILERLWAKLDEAGFKRFDLGVPPMLVPVRRGDYLLPNAIGLPEREDGTDTFGVYMNGGITAGHVLHFLAAHYVVGWDEPADRVLRAMLDRQQRGEFHNGVTDEAMRGIDWTTWDGRSSGYEGYLADSFRFLQAVVLREPQMREKLYRVLR